MMALPSSSPSRHPSNDLPSLSEMSVSSIVQMEDYNNSTTTSSTRKNDSSIDDSESTTPMTSLVDILIAILDLFWTCLSAPTSQLWQWTLAAFFSPTVSSVDKLYQRDWPPPALTALAVLTVLALFGHPDGYTWIVLGYVRSMCRSIWQSLAHLGEVLVQDYGVLPTLVASLTLAGLLALVAVALRSLTTSRKQKSAVPKKPERRKKKRSKVGRTTGRHATGTKPSSLHRIAATTATTSTTHSPSQLQHDETGVQVASHHAMITTTTTDTKESTTTTSPEPASSSSMMTTTTSQGDHHADRKRNRISTEDTTLTVDDSLSMDSSSTRSAVSSFSLAVGTTTTTTTATNKTTPTSLSVEMESLSETKLAAMETSTTTMATTSDSNNTTTTKLGAVTRGLKQRGGGKGKGDASSPKEILPSRWDALKPTSASNNNNTHRHEVNHIVHHREDRGGHASKPRRGGRGEGSRKASALAIAKGGRNNHNQLSTPGRKKNQPHRSAAPSPVSPPVILKRSDPYNAATSVETSLPPPPPGLGPLRADRPTNGLQLGVESSSLFLSPKYAESLACSSPLRWESAGVSSSFYGPPQQQWNQQPSLTASSSFSTPDRFGTSIASGSPSSACHLHEQSPSYGAMVKENPFAPENNNSSSSSSSNDMDSRIEADLQELGGQMAGSILDF